MSLVVVERRRSSFIVLVADRLGVTRLAGARFGVTGDGRVWVEVEVSGSEGHALWQFLDAHAAGWRAIEGTRKRLPAHRLKLCGSCGWPSLVVPATKRCKLCPDGKLTEVRLVWAGDETRG